MTLSRCTKNKYNDLLLFLSKAFGEDNEYWFCDNVPNCCPRPSVAKEEEINNHILVLDDEKIVGALGVYCNEWTVSWRDVSVNLKSAGIGQVATDPNYRNKGIMSKMLKQAIKDMEEESVDISWLFGERLRYGNFGWQPRGINNIFCFDKKTQKIILSSSDITGRIASADDIENLNQIYKKMPSYLSRTQKNWEIILNRKDIEVITDPGGLGYIITDKKNNIYEIAGELDSLKSLLKYYLQGIDNAKIHYPYAEDELSDFFYGSASEIIHEPLTQIRFTDSVNLMKKLTPIILSQAKWFNQDEESVSKILGELNPSECESLCKKLFDFPQSNYFDKLRFIQPLCIWTSHIEHI